MKLWTCIDHHTRYEPDPSCGLAKLFHKNLTLNFKVCDLDLKVIGLGIVLLKTIRAYVYPHTKYEWNASSGLENMSS